MNTTKKIIIILTVIASSLVLIAAFLIATIGGPFRPAQPTPPPVNEPTPMPEVKPTAEPTAEPASSSTDEPTPAPEAKPTAEPASSPASEPTPVPEAKPTAEPASSPTSEPTPVPEKKPTAEPASSPASEPTPAPEAPSTAESAFLSQHGALSVDGTDLVDCNGEKIQLYGVSTHGLAWFPQYVNEDAFRTLHDDWGINCIRLALYTDEYGGYCSGGDKDSLKNLIKSGISYATVQDMYVIVDWHILHDQDPNVHKEDSIAFFREISEEYADSTNIIYEICNEPNGYATWESVKSYAEEVIPIIRENDEDAVILVGSPTWSQDIDKAAANPLQFDNVMYTLHFYAATHKDDLRSRLKTCVDGGLPVFISEFGTCDASGNGANDFDQTSAWMELIEEYNLSFFSWNLSNKAESSSLISSSCSKTSDWTEDELSESGKWLRNYMRNK